MENVSRGFLRKTRGVIVVVYAIAIIGGLSFVGMKFKVAADAVAAAMPPTPTPTPTPALNVFEKSEQKCAKYVAERVQGDGWEFEQIEPAAHREDRIVVHGRATSTWNGECWQVDYECYVAHISNFPFNDKYKIWDSEMSIEQPHRCAE